MKRHPNPGQPVSRRDALCRMGNGFGMLGFASLASSIAKAAATNAPAPWLIDKPGFKPKAKRVIFLFMNGGLPRVVSFDPNPALTKYDGQPMPGGVLSHERKVGNLMKSPFGFEKYG